MLAAVNISRACYTQMICFIDRFIVAGADQ
jgi:hypothetical protein